jgi:hypothetical protein
MRRISLSLLALFLLLLSPLGTVQAQDSRASAQTGVVVPSGFEAFFDGLRDLMKKYPAAAKRYAITDRDIEGRPGFENRNATFARSLCSAGQHCSRICDVGELICCGTCTDILK